MTKPNNLLKSRLFKNHLRQLFRFHAPSACLLCDTFASHKVANLCATCRGDLPVQPRRCHRCAIALPAQAARARQSAIPMCGACLSHPPEFTEAFALSDYSLPFDKLLSQLKNHGDFTCARTLTELLLQSIRTSDRFDSFFSHRSLVPIPVHWLTRYRRGFNQSDLLARSISRMTNTPFRPEYLQQNSSRPAQKTLSRTARLKNMVGAFATPIPLVGKSILIVDDVVTTGATANAAARALFNAGAEDVKLLCIARTP